jgi:hypothetical protein
MSQEEADWLREAGVDRPWKNAETCPYTSSEET